MKLKYKSPKLVLLSARMTNNHWGFFTDAVSLSSGS